MLEQTAPTVYPDPPDLQDPARCLLMKPTRDIPLGTTEAKQLQHTDLSTCRHKWDLWALEVFQDLLDLPVLKAWKALADNPVTPVHLVPQVTAERPARPAHLALREILEGTANQVQWDPQELRVHPDLRECPGCLG